MHKQIWLSTFILLVIFMVSLSSHGVAQTYGQRTPVNEPSWGVKGPVAAAKAAAGRAARSNNKPYREVKDPIATAKAAAGRAALSNAALTVPLSKAMGTFLKFDAPGASNGTFPTSVSAAGVVAGYYWDANHLSHGFLRARNGTTVTFDVPGAVNGTLPFGVNNEGAITGGYGDNVGSGFHSFLRAPNGTVSTFDPSGSTFGSAGTAVNPDGTITGSYFSDENFAQHGFLRTRSGRIITIDAPDAVTGLPNSFVNGTFPFGITADGLILGVYSDANSVNFGFLMNAFGRFTKITGPGGLGGQYDFFFNPGPALSINPSGVIAGTYFQPISGNPFGGNFRVFARLPEGIYVTFDAANYPPCCIWSTASGINSVGTITGSFNDGFNINHGFWRTRSGSVTTFDVPGAGSGGTLPIGITTAGVIAGLYRDANRITHGFLFQPK
jgi:hypothetical protein